MTNQECLYNQIFVVGNSRSGTTLMGRILGKHSCIYTFNELHFFEEIWSPDTQINPITRAKAIEVIAHLIDIQRNGYLTQTNSDQFTQEACKIAEKLKDPILMPSVFAEFMNYEAALNHKNIACEQTPRNVFYIDEILKFFPNAKIINMIRDPRDILLSQKRRWRRPFLSNNKIPISQSFRYWVNYHPITISKLWNASVGSANHFSNNPRVYSVRFEDLLVNPESVVRKICTFIDIHFDPSLLDIPQIGSSSEQDQPERRGINADRSESWRKGGLNNTEIFLCQKITATFMEQYGYLMEPTRSSFLLLLSSFISFPFKLVLALVLSLNRMRRIGETIKRRILVPKTTVYKES